MKELLMIFLGGGLGSVARYLIGSAIGKNGVIAFHTLTVNIVGSLIIGITMTLLSKNPTHPLVFLLSVGFCGGFTTFSTFSLEVFTLFKEGNVTTSIIYISISIIASVLAVLLGYFIAQSIK